MGRDFFEEEVIIDNAEIVSDILPFDPTEIVVYSRDWTIETIFSQIKGKNIDLNPEYQRRNAWSDEKRGKLIESILIGYPIPEIVLAEDPKQKKSFAVIDGKQRLLTIAGFIQPEAYKYWDKPVLKGLSVKENLNKINYEQLSTDGTLSNEFRQFLNASLRCTVITNFKENDVLYDIFYRLNSGSVPLSTQELRQSLNRGQFANFLIAVTNENQPIHDVMKLDEPDKRLRDIEVLLRCISMILFAKSYTGNLKAFLDDSMSSITKDWSKFQPDVKLIYKKINDSIALLGKILGGVFNVGRKYSNGQPEKRFNRVLLEVQIYYFVGIDPATINEQNSIIFVGNFIRLCQDDAEFRASIEATTKSLDNYKIRFKKFQDLVNASFDLSLSVNPF